MRWACQRLLGSFLGLLLASGSAIAEPQKDRCVILVSVDGLAGFYFDDPVADMPTLRRLAKEGARAEGMVCSFPTVTWPNHTTLVTGVPPAKHGVIGNNFLDRKSGSKVPFIPDPLFDKEEIVKSPTVYDVAHQAGLNTAAIIWPATRNARTLNWTVPDMAGNESWEKYGTPHWLAELKAEGFPIDRYGPWVKEGSGGVQRDWLTVRMARQLLHKHKPNLLLIHLVETDHVQHRHGPRTGDAYWSVSYADDRIADLVKAIETSPLKDKTTLFICSDHGFYPIKRDIQPNVALRKLGLITVESGKATAKSAFCVSEGGGCSVYILDDKRWSEIDKKLREEFAKVEGIEAVIGIEDFAKIGQATPDKDPHAPDLWLAAKKDYSFGEGISGEAVVVDRAAPGGTHGYLPDQPDLLATCVVWGAGIEPGSKLGKIQNLDIAPTMAKMLGVEMPTAEGKALTEMMSK